MVNVVVPTKLSKRARELLPRTRGGAASQSGPASGGILDKVGLG